MSEPIQTEDDLRYWLSEEDWYPSRHTQDWLAQTDPRTANDLLARLTADAAPEPRHGWEAFWRTVAVAGFSMSSAVAGPGVVKRKAGTRAALLLAERGDVRALAPLARVWDTQNKYQELIEDALLRFLSQTPPETLTGETTALRELAARIWHARPLRRDLAPRFAEIVVAILPILDQAGGEENAAFLREIAQTTSFLPPQRQRVQHTAQSLADVLQ